ncbi:MAG: PDZ domain-containing protein [Saprospiraceae bacterium]|nr:PDZ domain-containing protein [Saprospiraceae bacterium]
MKTTRFLLLFTTFLLFPWCASQLFSQQEGAKKVVITKRTMDADGAESSETIVKKGAAAENFDVDKYIAENRGDNTWLELKVTGGDDERTVIIKGSKTVRINESADEEDDDDEDSGSSYQGYPGYEGYKGYEGFKSLAGIATCNDNGAFLGVDEDSDEKADQPGLVVNVVRGSAADQAGLHDNDKIMKLNDTPINQWSDLSKFVGAAKVGDKVRIAYERNGKPASTEATLSNRSGINHVMKREAKGFLGVSDHEERDEKDKPGVAVVVSKGSAAEKAGLQTGDVIFQLGDAPISDFEDITDFMAYTKPGEKVSVVYERSGKRNTAVAILSEQKNIFSVLNGDWDLGDLDPGQWNLLGSGNKGNCTVNVRAKDACLGVFSDAFSEGKAEGSRINDFTDESAAREVNMAKGDIITAVNGERVKNHEDLWHEIAKYKVGDKVKVEYLREGKTMAADVALKACRDNSSRVQILDGNGGQVRNFTSWNWNEDDQRQLRERSIITIRRGEGDAPKVNAMPNGQAESQDRSLKLNEFRAFPNPTQGQITVEFRSEPVATTVSFFDLSGRQLFREELNAFNGRYSQQFDLSEFAKGTIIVHVQQADKVFTEQVIVN